MSRYYDDDDYDDDAFDVRGRTSFRDDRRHSGPGVVAFAMAILAAIGMVISTVLFAVLGMGPAPVPDDDPVMILTVILFLGSGCISFAGLALGFGGAFQSDRKPLYAMLGMSLNAAVLFGMVVLICIGVWADA